MPTIRADEWAQIWARANVGDPPGNSLKNSFQKNPLVGINEFRTVTDGGHPNFPNPPQVQLLDIDTVSYDPGNDFANTAINVLNNIAAGIIQKPLVHSWRKP